MFIYRINEANSSNSFSRGFPSHSIMSSLVWRKWRFGTQPNWYTLRIQMELKSIFESISFMVEIAFSLTLFLPSLSLFYSKVMGKWYNVNVWMCVCITFGGWLESNESLSMSCKFTLYRYSRVNSSIPEDESARVAGNVNHNMNNAFASFNMHYDFTELPDNLYTLMPLYAHSLNTALFHMKNCFIVLKIIKTMWKVYQF